MTSAIVGWTGFVGQYLTQYFPQSDLYNSENVDSLRGKSYDTIYFSAMPAEKWKINKDPSSDMYLVTYFCDLLDTVRCNEFVLISTVDVLNCSILQSENGTDFSSHPYGQHRKRLEDYVMTRFSNHIILRLPGLFGKGLKKNVIYDLLNDNQIENICLESSFQYYNLENLYNDIIYCRTNSIKLIHLVTDPIFTKTIVERYFPDKRSMCKGTNRVSYTLTTNHPIVNTLSILDQLGEFIKWNSANKGIIHRIAVSNIAWKPNLFVQVEKILKRYELNRIEMAFTTLYDWSEWNDEAITSILKQKYTYPSCQSILFNTGVEIFKNTSAFFIHFAKVLKLCKSFNIKNIVLGSPRQRHIYDTSYSQRIEIFRCIGNMCSEYDVVLCIEPNSHKYGCTWLTTFADVVEFIMSLDHTNVRINFDFGNYLMENDTSDLTRENVVLVKNVQISAPFLSCINNDLLENYKIIWKRLLENGYCGNVSLETRPNTMSEFILSCDTFNKIITSHIL
jgi:hydroxypyruvate isomerase